MNEIGRYAMAGMAGFAAGFLFFYGLWLTVLQFQARPPSIAFLLISFVGRTVLTLGLLWWATQGDASRVIISLLGLLGARVLVLRLTRGSLPSKRSQNAS